MAKSNTFGNKQKHGSSRKNYFLNRTRTMKQGSKGSFRYQRSIDRNISKK